MSAIPTDERDRPKATHFGADLESYKRRADANYTRMVLGKVRQTLIAGVKALGHLRRDNDGGTEKAS